MKRILTIISLLNIGMIANAQVDLKNGLMAYYPFNGNAYDESGNSNDPSLAKVSYTTDRFGNADAACLFNGKSNYIRIPDHPTLSLKTSYTISCWVLVKDFYEGKCHGNRIIMKGYQDRDNGNYLVTFDDNVYSNGANCSSKVDKKHQQFYTALARPVSEKYVETGKWYFLLATYDGKESVLYVDCEVAAKGEKENYNFSNEEDLFFGKLDNPNYPYWFNGILDEVRIYNRVLSKEEITALCNEKPENK